MTAISPQHSLTLLRRRAAALGLRSLGVSPALPPRRLREFEHWLSQGRAGTMSYLARSLARRGDPTRILPGAKSIISVTQNYFTESLPPEIRDDPSRGLIASYAWGDDYHEVLLAKLEQLAETLRELGSGVEAKCYVDTGHLLERDYAESSGLGFTGKNTMLIDPAAGSYFFLGEILTTLELPPTPAVGMPSCGSCTKCLQVCPTHALPAEYILDSNLCISYLTIEYKGAIARKLRPLMGNHIFGCDDCQDCCPWVKRFSTPTEERAYYASLDRKAPKLSWLATLSEAEFHSHFAGSPVLRPKYRGFLRNVAVALGNWGSAEALAPLQTLLQNSEPLVRLHAAWAIGQINSPEAKALLQESAANDSAPDVRAEAQFCLSSS